MNHSLRSSPRARVSTTAVAAAHLILCATVGLQACSTPEGPADSGVRADVPSVDATTGMDGATTDSSVADSGVLDVPMVESGPPPDSSCASIAAMSRIVRRPLDVIAIVDSTSSFNPPRMAINATLVPNLIRALEDAMVDYRVVVVGGDVMGPATNPRYRFVSEGIGTTELLIRMPGYLRRALPHLRTDSLKAIVDFTDDDRLEPTMSLHGTRAQFYMGMSAADLVPYFGTMTSRRYTVHAVAGLGNNTPSSTPWPPSAPLVTTMCSGFRAFPAPELQELARETGGYRFPLCNFAEYSRLFDAVAAQAIASTRVPCEFGVPMLTDGRVPDLSYARLTVSLSDGTSNTSRPVRNESECGDGFYAVRGAVSDAGTTGDIVRLCPVTCDRVQRDSSAMVRFTFECPPG